MNLVQYLKGNYEKDKVSWEEEGRIILNVSYSQGRRYRINCDHEAAAEERCWLHFNLFLVS